MATPDFLSDRMTRAEAAHYLGVSVQFLEADAVGGLHQVPYYKLGRKVYYRRSELDVWLASRRTVAGARREEAAA